MAEKAELMTEHVAKYIVNPLRGSRWLPDDCADAAGIDWSDLPGSEPEQEDDRARQHRGGSRPTKRTGSGLSPKHRRARYRR